MPFKIFLIYHSHIDIGYTERQEKIGVYQADFIKQAVDCALSPAQNQRDCKSKFKFTAEGFWAVEQFLNRYGEDGKRKLIQAVKDGGVELTGGYLHFAELLNYENLNHSLSYAQNFAEENGIKKIDVAMSADVNGFSYGYSQAMYDNGIRYLVTNINTHHGGAPFNKPLVPFYWKTPNGDRILVWSGLAYHKANLLGLIPGSTPVGDPGVPGMKVTESGHVEVNHPDDYAKKRIFDMVSGLKDNGYAYDFLPLMGSGLYTDNSPTGDGHCKLVNEWNAAYGDKIEIVTATLSEFFTHLEQTKQIPEYSGEWNDWWTDGTISTPNETRLFRNAQRTAKLVKKLDSANVISGAEHEAIANKLILYAEHTWGHSHSYHEPSKLLVSQLDFRKASHAIDADKLAMTALDKVCRSRGEGEFCQRRPFEYVVINPNDFDAEVAVYLPTDFWEDAMYEKKFFVADGKDKIAAQRVVTLRGSFVTAVIKLKANEERTLNINFGSDEIKTESALKLSDNDLIYENKFYRMAFGEQGVLSYVDKKTGKELLKQGNFLGQPIYQVFENAERSAAAGFGYGVRNIPTAKIFEGTVANRQIIADGGVLTRIKYDYTVRGVLRYSVTFTLVKELARIEMSVDLAKELVIDPEGLYTALPFCIDEGEWYLDKPLVMSKPGEQLPMTCCDYYSVDKGYVLANKKQAIAITALDAPMVTFGKIKLWEYSTSIDNGGIAYSWLMNNKWETNFRLSLAGFFESRYILEALSALSSPKDALITLQKNEFEPVVLRK